MEMVSIIMAAFNAQKTIGKAIESVIQQSYQNWELIVINDCSSDDTPEIVERYSDSRIKLINNEHNYGVSRSRKRGLAAAKGNWIAILDSDDAWVPDKLEKQLCFARESKASIVFSGSAFMDSEGRPLNWILHVPHRLGYRELLKQNLISNSSVLIKKDLYKSHYVTGDDLHEDFAIWLSITKSGIDAYGIDEPLLIYRLAKASKSGNKLKAARMNWNTYRYSGLNVFSAFYYMCWYTVRGLKKYKNLV